MQKNYTVKHNYLYVDGIRALAAVYVMMSHITGSFHLHNSSAVTKAISSFFQYSHDAVGVFIVISGFCLMIPVLDNDYKLPQGILKFYKRRFIRIYPTYFISGLLAIVLINFVIGDKTGMYWDMTMPINSKAIITHLFLIHDFFYDTIYKINPVLWSVSVECRIYLIFPLMLWLCRRWSVLTALALSFVASFFIWVVLIMLYKHFPLVNASYSGVHPYLILFTSGMFAAYASFKTGALKMPWLVILFIFIIIRVGLQLTPNGTTFKDISIGFCASLLLLSIESCRHKRFNIRWVEKMLSLKWLVFIGTYAYSIYLFHPLFIQLIYKLARTLKIEPLLSDYLMITAGAAFTLVMCYGLFLAFETPFLTYNKKRQIIEATIKEPAP